jgi:DNA-binding transcriptional regulator YhcF (GntR family)
MPLTGTPQPELFDGDRTLPVTSIAAGVDVRTVAGRLGHGGGGTTTLRVYAAWVAEADLRAAAGLAARLPARPAPQAEGMERVLAAPRTPYERIAVKLRGQILDGHHPVGQPLPIGEELAEAHHVAKGTAQRAVILLRTWGLVDVSRGQRAVVRPLPATAPNNLEREALSPAAANDVDDSGGTAMAPPHLWAITMRGPDGRRYLPRHVREDIDQPDSFRPHLLAIARMEAPQHTDGGENWIGDFELEVRELGEEHNEPKLTLRWQTT